jgi:hypothetical protein
LGPPFLWITIRKRQGLDAVAAQACQYLSAQGSGSEENKRFATQPSDLIEDAALALFEDRQVFSQQSLKFSARATVAIHGEFESKARNRWGSETSPLHRI